MNEIKLKGIIKNIEYSHTINNIDFYKANLIVAREDGKEDLINLKFKHFSNPYKENETIELIGNVRTYNHKIEDRNKVDLFVFTYFDKPEEELQSNNEVIIDGQICKKNNLKRTTSGKDVLDFILANHLDNNNQILNTYLPCVVWGKLAKYVDSQLNVGSKIQIKGILQSREYKKKTSENDYELRLCHELKVIEINTLEEKEEIKEK